MAETISVIRVIASCAIVCGLAWALGIWLRKSQPLSSNARRQLRLLEILPLGGGKSLALVAYRHRRFIIALMPQSIQLLAEVGENTASESEVLEDRGDGEAGGNSFHVPHSASYSQNESSPNSLFLTQLKVSSLRRFSPFLPLLLSLVVFASVASSQPPNPNPQFGLSLMRESLQILMLLTLIALAPFLLSVMTCFTRIVIVLSLLRVAMGTPQTPPNPVIIGIALFLTLFVMAPTLQEVKERGLEPFFQNKISVEQAIAEGYKPFQKFMLRQVREKDIALFLRVARMPNPKRPEDTPAYILVPAFILSEIRTGFEIGFLLSVPFLVLDLVVASVLMGMGMLMVPPMLISLPLKLLLFVLADGWHLLMRGLALSVR